jgi:uncharacterized protein (DUF2267 family)
LLVLYVPVSLTLWVTVFGGFPAAFSGVLALSVVARLMLSALELNHRESKMNEKSFVREVAQLVDCDERRAETLIFAVFQELRDRFTPNEAVKVASQLPTSLKMLWMSFDRPDRQVRRVHEPQFLCEVSRMVGLDNEVETERAVVAVFAALQDSLGSFTRATGVAGHVMSQLPSDLKRLWLAAERQK